MNENRLGIFDTIQNLRPLTLVEEKQRNLDVAFAEKSERLSTLDKSPFGSVTDMEPLVTSVSDDKDIPIEDQEFPVTEPTELDLELDKLDERAASLEGGFQTGWDNDGRLLESVDLAQSQGLKLYADSANQLRKTSRYIADFLGYDPDELGLTLNPRLLGTEQLVQDVREDPWLRDRIAGVKPRTRDEWDAEKNDVLFNVEDKEYAKAAWGIITNLDRYFAESAPEMGLLMSPGGVFSLTGIRLSNQMEEFKKNNDRDMTMQEAALTGLAILATLYPEKLFKLSI